MHECIAVDKKVAFTRARRLEAGPWSTSIDEGVVQQAVLDGEREQAGQDANGDEEGEQADFECGGHNQAFQNTLVRVA